ncbi:hypothetical protein [Sutcliffiella rhizosphaerae]|uniref:Uncharacterized protein n=1 Tax=Sutcliffiella rhizosphaerae TaxID=2880967 RepID=A0ABN8ABC1_9BACI|nr:hypothetical protein [Sutcliffiella rhizosphaerae]CAG9621347.1 hypothetical protein BACCIP111883_02119 [Sutcliffiella rhizosphaerae]
MPVWLWFLIGFAILLAFGAIVDYFGKRKRSVDPSAVHKDVDQMRSKHESNYR